MRGRARARDHVVGDSEDDKVYRFNVSRYLSFYPYDFSIHTTQKASEA